MFFFSFQSPTLKLCKNYDNNFFKKEVRALLEKVLKNNDKNIYANRQLKVTAEPEIK